MQRQNPAQPRRTHRGPLAGIERVGRRGSRSVWRLPGQSKTSYLDGACPFYRKVVRSPRRRSTVLRQGRERQRSVAYRRDRSAARSGPFFARRDRRRGSPQLPERRPRFPGGQRASGHRSQGLKRFENWITPHLSSTRTRLASGSQHRGPRSDLKRISGLT
jgi:hypothetical protein